MGKNASKLYYPWKESIMSILPLVDEFIIALGDCDEDDNSRSIIESIASPKIRIIDTIWDLKVYPNGTENAHQTNIAKSYCTGDWLFYLQADEVVHENDLPLIKAKCQEYLHNKNIEGLLFQYKHFWGSYDKYHNSHTWYNKEIRIIRNQKDIHSWESAQSFRRIPNFNGQNYRQQEGTFKLKVAQIDATIYHYGWVRPPELMMLKQKSLDTIHKGKEKVLELEKQGRYIFDYGPLQKLTHFSGTHPEVMQNRIKEFNWVNSLQFSGKVNKNRKRHKHEQLKYKLISWIENKLLCGTKIGGFKNYIIKK